MDATRFDAAVRSLFGATSRRAALVSALAGIGALRDGIELAAGKKKKCKGKKKRCGRRCCPRSRGCCKGPSGKTCCPKGGGDTAPPCTVESCPLPPGCSDEIFETCGTAVRDALVADAEPCRATCEGGDSLACRACLEPIVLARQADAEACIVESCSSSARASVVDRERAASRAWFERICSKACCHSDLQQCQEDARDEWLFEMAGAIIVCFAPPPAGLLACLPTMLGIQARLLYNDQKCQYRFGCEEDGPYWGSCGENDTCCPHTFASCGDTCCTASQTCCFNSWCCSEPGAACCKTTGGDEYCCFPGLQCKLSGGNTCQL